MSNSIQPRGAGTIQQNAEGALKPDDVFDAELSAEMVKRTARLNDTTIDLAVRLKDARTFMAWSASHMRGAWLDWQDEAKGVLQDLTQFRMAVDRESKQILGAAKDVRDFFTSPDYLQSHATLKEMVSLLERFQQLKADGTLDAFADFILKTSCR